MELVVRGPRLVVLMLLGRMRWLLLLLRHVRRPVPKVGAPMCKGWSHNRRYWAHRLSGFANWMLLRRRDLQQRVGVPAEDILRQREVTRVAQFLRAWVAAVAVLGVRRGVVVRLLVKEMLVGRRMCGYRRW